MAQRKRDQQFVVDDPVIRAMMKKHKKPGFGQYVLGFFLLLYTLFCFIPFLLVVICAFSDEMSLRTKGFSFFPEAWSYQGMKMVLGYGKKLLDAYMVTIGVTVTGTFFGLFVMSMFAYAISRKDFRLKGFLSIYLIIPMLPDVCSLEANAGIAESIEDLRGYTPELKVLGILFNKYDNRTNLAKQVRSIADGIAEQLDTRVFDTYIHNAVAMGESVYPHIGITDYQKRSAAAEDIRMLVTEIEERIRSVEAG